MRVLLETFCQATRNSNEEAQTDQSVRNYIPKV